MLGQTDALKGFKVNGNIGQLILPKEVITVEDTYSVTVTTSEKISFVVEAGKIKHVCVSLGKFNSYPLQLKHKV